MIEIFVDEISERAAYTFDFVLKDNGIEYKFNNDFKSFEASENLKFNYSDRYFDDVVQLKPSTLLFEETIVKYHLTKGKFESEDCLTFNKITDPFAAIFFILSRMEEYGDVMHDEHERFPANQSVLDQFGWLQKMVCERWSKTIIQFLHKNELTKKFYEKRPLTIIPTFDIDNAYAYKLKDGSRKILSVIKDNVNRNKTRLVERKDVLSNIIPDPYDTYSKIQSISDQGFDVQLFWLLGDFGPFDKNIHFNNEGQKELIQSLSKQCSIGIHPSYKSNSKPGQIKIEAQRLAHIINEPTKKSRQHFLKFRLPGTFKALIEAGIEHDYSMGYASEVGFRAGTSRSFQWFDLEKNFATNLIIHPFAYMDGTLLEYKKFNIEEAKIIISSLFDEFCHFGGEFIFLWHNETIGDYGKWKGWSEVLEHTLGLRITD